MQKVELQASNRDVMGKAVRNLRREGILPAVVYGRGFDSKSIQVDYKAFEQALSEAGESTIVELKLGKDTYPTIINDVVRDPVSSELVHADFYKVRLDEKIDATVPIVFRGESPAVKDLDGILVKNIQEIEVSGFPQDLPHEIVVDLGKLIKIGDQVHVGQLAISDKLEIKVNPDDIVALIQEPMSQEEYEASVAEDTTTSVDDVKDVEKEKKENEPEGETKSEEKAEEKSGETK